MALTGERDYGSRHNGIRASLDGYASIRKRASVSLSLANWTPLSASKTEPQLPALASLKQSKSSRHHHHYYHHHHNHHSSSSSSRIMSSFFSRFSSKNKARLSIATDLEPGPNRHSKSMPNTPSIPGKLSIPIVDPLPPLSASRTLEQFPLCVAYVQAIRASSLPACTLSSEKILRQEVEKGTRRGRGMHRHHVSTNSVDLEWTRKLFVLVPGILLQYSGEGTDDRLPEKVLQLSASSLAFASDAIPGRPWVLQVCRSSGEDGVGAFVPEKRSAFIAKVTFRGGIRNSASALLLVFESAEDMDSWMGLIRAEAVRLGGVPKKKTSSSKPIKKTEEREGEERERRKKSVVMVTKDRDDSEWQSPFSRRIVINRDDNAGNGWSSSDENITTSKRASTYRNSIDADRSTISNDQMVLDQLRGSRLSLHSGGDKTRIMTVSPDTSPERYSTKSSSASYKRQSLALSAQSRSSVELRPLQPTNGLSAIDKDGNLYWIPRTPSPTAHNFLPPTYRQPRTLPASPSPSRTISAPLLSVPSSRTISAPLLSVPSSRTISAPLLSVPSPSTSYFRTDSELAPSQPSTPRPQLRHMPNSIQPTTQSPSTTSSHTRPNSLQPTATPPPARPLSLQQPTTPTRPRPHSHQPTAFSIHAAPIVIPESRRRSLGMMESELARGAPRYPPPSTPLPQVPAMGLSQSLPKGGSGGNWAAMEKRRERRRSRQAGLGMGLGISGVEGEVRRSFDAGRGREGGLLNEV